MNDFDHRKPVAIVFSIACLVIVLFFIQRSYAIPHHHEKLCDRILKSQFENVAFNDYRGEAWSSFGFQLLQ